jgi:catechol 2,3-dioxygenase-like lactoylglutathione lyase family enzyme
MPNVHVHLHVADLEASRAFYERFLGAAPVKVKPGYVKFLPPLAPLNLALSTGAPERGGTISHLGFQVDTKAQVVALLDQAKAAGLAVREEMGTDCCFANQDKFWVLDPDGVEWEVYHLNHDLEDEEGASAARAGCCTPLARIGKRP